MARRASGGIDQIKVAQPLIHPAARRAQMADGRNAANGKAGGLADKRRIGLGQRLARHFHGLLRVDLITARGQEQQGKARVLAPEDDRFGDLIDMAAGALRGLGGGAGLSDLKDIGRKLCRHKGRCDTF